ncbi:hypothetical protein Zm00014a_031007 [Zea mays]|uniref:Uncharacterized protein n=1 Tax=Zea mays TaxID=4577 RepID=A0A3L6DM64_MAIZE|nr:hypothetical protein Zm00014a_031007 [Zea mays]
MIFCKIKNIILSGQISTTAEATA